MNSYYAMLRERQSQKPSSMTNNHMVKVSKSNNNNDIGPVRPANHRSFSNVIRNEGRKLAAQTKKDLKNDFKYTSDRSQALMRRLNNPGGIVPSAYKPRRNLNDPGGIVPSAYKPRPTNKPKKLMPSAWGGRATPPIINRNKNT